MKEIKEALAMYIGGLLAIIICFAMVIPLLYIFKFFAYVYSII